MASGGSLKWNTFMQFLGSDCPSNPESLRSVYAYRPDESMQGCHAVSPNSYNFECVDNTAIQVVYGNEFCSYDSALYSSPFSTSGCTNAENDTSIFTGCQSSNILGPMPVPQDPIIYRYANKIINKY